MQRPVRVLQFMSSLGLGGAETAMMNVFRHIDRTRVLFDAAVYATPGFYDDEFRSRGGRIFRLPYPGLHSLAGHLSELRRIFREDGPFVAVHSHNYYYSGLALSAARLAGVPIRIAHSHTTRDGKPSTALRTGYRWLMRRLTHANATHLVGCSAAACAALFGRACTKVEVVGNAIDPTDFPSDGHETREGVRSALGLRMEDFVLAHVGSFSPTKNHAAVVDTFSELIAMEPSARLLLIGAGPLRARIEERCRTLGLGKSVVFLGLRNDVPAVLSACDAFVFPSFYEGLPVAVIEAQMAGLPCIVSEAVPETADLGLGLLTRLSLGNSAGKWARRILSAGRQESPPWEERQRRLLLAGFDIRQTVHRWESLYLAGRHGV
jgi:glycosyltransferase involved in cell wall biosynthesis